jgi:hypothetical protein
VAGLRNLGQRKPIKLLETDARFPTFINPAQSSIIHLIGAIEDYHIFGQGFAHIFHGFCFACARWTTWGTAHTHGEGLSQGYVTSETHHKVG